MPKVTPIRTGAQLISSMSDAQLACRASYHPWPVLRADAKKLPKGMEVTPLEGCYQITETCPSCGKRRTTTTASDSATGDGSTYWYEDPDGWVTIPSDLGVSKADLRAENRQRAMPLIKAAAREAS